MWRLILFFVLAGSFAWGAGPLKPGPASAPSPALTPEAEALIRRYRTDDRSETKREALQSLCRLQEPRVGEFLEREFEKLDASVPDDARLAGIILQTWGARPNSVTVPYLIYEGLFHEDPAVVRACAEGITRMPADARALLSTGRAAPGRDPADEIAVDLISRMIQRPELFHPLERVLVIWSGKPRPGYQAATDLAARPDEATRTAGITHWKQWFEQRFRQTFEPVLEKGEAEKSDEEVYKFLLGDSGKGGEASRGAKVFTALRCNDCHGSAAIPGATNRLFGPDLSRVTQRLSRTELADALVYPSRQVAAKFKAMAITLKDSTVLKGYILDQNAESITLAGRKQVRRLERSTVASVEPQAESLMPAHSLNRASGEEIRDLLKFLESLDHGRTDR